MQWFGTRLFSCTIYCLLLLTSFCLFARLFVVFSPQKILRTRLYQERVCHFHLIAVLWDVSWARHQVRLVLLFGVALHPHVGRDGEITTKNKKQNNTHTHRGRERG